MAFARVSSQTSAHLSLGLVAVPWFSQGIIETIISCFSQVDN